VQFDPTTENQGCHGSGNGPGSITSCCLGKEPALLPEVSLGEERRPEMRERWKSNLEMARGKKRCLKSFHFQSGKI